MKKFVVAVDYYDMSKPIGYYFLDANDSFDALDKASDLFLNSLTNENDDVVYSIKLYGRISADDHAYELKMRSDTPYLWRKCNVSKFHYWQHKQQIITGEWVYIID